MLNLQLRDEFLGPHMPGTAIALRRQDKTGAAQQGPEQILSITYPTADVLTALRAVSTRRAHRPVVLMGERGRGGRDHGHRPWVAAPGCDFRSDRCDAPAWGHTHT